MYKLSIFIISLSILASAGCANKRNPGTTPEPAPAATSPTVGSGKYAASEYKGNYVWAGAMNLAWNELCDNIIHDKIALKTDDPKALETSAILNNPSFTKNDLDSKSYYVKSGYGQKTVDEINKECRKKFPDKSFEDLDLDLSDSDIISYAYLLKAVEYKMQFSKKDVTFDGKTVKGFFVKESGERKNIKILAYESDEKFIVSLQLKDDNDQLILAKGYDMSNPDQILKEISANKNAGEEMGKSDRFEAPMIHLDHHRDYKEMQRKSLTNKGFESYFIAEMFENIKFDMDEKGARVENEAVIVMTKSAPLEQSNPRKLIFDKPYWIVMQRKDSPNPYFLLGVKNTGLMKE